MGKSGAPENGNISVVPTTTATKKNTKKKYAYYNKGGQRLDEPLPPKDPSAVASLEARMKKVGKKMCNHWHLGGHCENGKFCHFQHEPKLTTAELNALRYKTRSLACKNRYCENIDCCKYIMIKGISDPTIITAILVWIHSAANTSTSDLGHQCALERDQGYCSFPDNCKHHRRDKHLRFTNSLGHLRATHGMDRVKYVRYDKDGNEDYAP